MKNVSELPHYSRFHKEGRILLTSFLEDFLNCRINIQIHPIADFESGMHIDITTNLKRAYYEWGSNNEDIIIVSRVYGENNTILAILPIRLTGYQLAFLPRTYFDRISNAISERLTICYAHKFEYSIHYFGDTFAKQVIARCVNCGRISFPKKELCISLIEKLSTTTFEDEFFSTAFIFTRSIFDYRDRHRNGSLISMQNQINLVNALPINRRFWYVADGTHSVFLLDSSLMIKNIFVIDLPAHIDNNTLPLFSFLGTLKGSDTLFQVTGQNQVSIINSDGIEISCSESKWRLRNYGVIRLLFKESVGLSDSVVDNILYYIMNCSHQHISSILWFPNDTSSNVLGQVLASQYSYFKPYISICEYTNRRLVMRILSSDGATIINKEGSIIYHGAIVKLNTVDQKNSLVGTGESAARLLCSNGCAVKISQDGTIKIFSNNNCKPFVF